MKTCLFALFVVGSGLALLQVAINPYVGALGKPETASSRLNLCGGLNSLARSQNLVCGRSYRKEAPMVFSLSCSHIAGGVHIG